MVPRECKRLAKVDFLVAEVSRHSVREWPAAALPWRWPRNPVPASPEVARASRPLWVTLAPKKLFPASRQVPDLAFPA